jgi:hypothetical protein
MRRHPPHHLSPARANARQGKTPKRASATPSHHSNAPVTPESQSFLSKIVAQINGSSWLLDQQFETHSLRQKPLKILGFIRISNIEPPDQPPAKSAETPSFVRSGSKWDYLVIFKG